MRRYRRFVAMLWALVAVLCPALALGQTSHISAELIAESPGFPGQTVTMAIHMRPEPGWHGYWSNPGDAGQGMTLDWTLPAGAKAGSPRYPVPETLLISGLMNHVYEHEYALLVSLTLPVRTSVAGLFAGAPDTTL